MDAKTSSHLMRFDCECPSNSLHCQVLQSGKIGGRLNTSRSNASPVQSLVSCPSRRHIVHSEERRREQDQSRRDSVTNQTKQLATAPSREISQPLLTRRRSKGFCDCCPHSPGSEFVRTCSWSTVPFEHLFQVSLRMLGPLCSGNLQRLLNFNS